MTAPLRALIVEDSATDGELLLLELRRLGFDTEHRQVETAQEMSEALANTAWDIVFSDFSMPRFSALSALEILRKSTLDIPFVIVSGTISEEIAIEALRAGARDFLVKGRLARLHSVIDRELNEAQSRRQKRQLEAALREREAQYRRIVETAEEGIWALDADGRTTYLNRRMEELLGRSASEVDGRSFLEFVDPAWAPRAREYFERRHRGIRERQELPLIGPEGSTYWTSISTSPIHDGDGNFVGSLGMVTDITERRELQAQLMAADRMASIGTLAAGVAHELRNALAGVLANVELAARDLERLAGDRDPDAVSARMKDELEVAREGIERVHMIARDLNVLSHPGEDEVRSVDLRRPLASAHRLCRDQVNDGVRFVVDLQPVAKVKANEARLVQVFLNLVTNAVQAAPQIRTGLHEVRLATGMNADGTVFAEVRDSGVGMSAETLGKLFTPFFTTKAAGEGTGLGLAICRRIVESFGGEIEVESRLGEGAAFRIRLPGLADEELEAAHGELERRPQMRRSSLLVVDDEPVVLGLARRILDDFHDVTPCSTAVEALRRIDAGEVFDLIVSDLTMPEMSGIEFYRALLDRAHVMAGRVVFLTGGSSTEAGRSFLESAGVARLEKPFRVQELIKFVEGELQSRSVD